MAPAETATPRPSSARRRCPGRLDGTAWPDGTAGSDSKVWSAVEPPVMRSRCVLTTVNVTAMGASTIRKTQRQDHVEVSPPAIGGPIREGSTHAAETQL